MGRALDEIRSSALSVTNVAAWRKRTRLEPHDVCLLWQAGLLLVFGGLYALRAAYVVVDADGGPAAPAVLAPALHPAAGKQRLPHRRDAHHRRAGLPGLLPPPRGLSSFRRVRSRGASRSSFASASRVSRPPVSPCLMLFGE